MALQDSQLEFRKTYPSPQDIDFQGFAEYLSKSERLRTTNSYFFDNYVDLSRMYKEIFITQKRVFKEMVAFMSTSLSSFAKRGFIKQEYYPGYYIDLADALVTVTTFWGHYQAVMPTGLSYMKNAVWSIILPSMTPEGVAEFERVVAPTLEQRTEEG